MRRIIGILFVLMLAASVGATGGYGGLYVNNRVPGMGLLRAAQNSNTLYIHLIAKQTASHSEETAICRAGNSSRKIESTGTNGYMYIR